MDVTGGLDETLAVLSHQLKSPINAIQEMLATILEGYGGAIDPAVRQFLERSLARATEASQLVAGLLDFERYQQGAAPGPGEETELGDLLASLARHYQPAAAEKGLVLESALPERDRIVVRGNRAALSNVVRNLVENAITYSPPGGRITVTLAAEAGRCRFSVSDTGSGIPAEDLPRLFTPFFRSSRQRHVVTGTGLGLAVARRIVESHGGTITAVSPQGAGSTFTVELPLLRIEPRQEAVGGTRRRVVIIGGVTSGPKAAARLRRLDESLDITIVERSELFSYAGCGLPQYVGGKVRSPKALMVSADGSARDVEWFSAIKDIGVMNRTEAIGIDRSRREVRVRNLGTGAERTVPYDVLVLATGAKARAPAIPGLDGPGVYSLYNVLDAERMRELLASDQAKDVCIIGGGLIGIETAEPLMSAGARVTLLEREPTILAHLFDPEIGRRIQGELSRTGMKIVTSATIQEVTRQGEQMGIRSDRGSFLADLVILAAGVEPNVDLARDCGLEIGPSGGIKVNSCLQTSDERIYAIGDCAETLNSLSGRLESWPLGSISTKMGRLAADNIAGRRREFPGFIGTALVKVFNLSIGRTGLTAAAALAAGYDPVSALVAGMDKSPYTGAAHRLTLKVIADRSSRVILGAEGYGPEIFARMPTLACAISQGMSLAEFFGIDFGHAPAFNSSIDISQTACLVLENKLDGLLETVSPDELASRRGEVRLVDVSPSSEHALGSIPGSLNVPLENLRSEELPFGRQEPIVLYSRASAGAYEAARFLRSQGYENVRVLEGGYAFWEQ